MKKIFIIIIAFILLITPVFASEDDDGNINSMSDFLGKEGDVFDNPFAGQKMYTDEDFQKALEEKKAQMNKKKRKKKSAEINTDKGLDDTPDDTYDKYIVITLPVGLLNGDGTYIPTGHYKIVGVKENGKVFLDFYQAYQKIARVPAIETRYDFAQKEINFAKVLEYSDERVKIIYGSLDFNAWTFLRIVN